MEGRWEISRGAVAGSAEFGVEEVNIGEEGEGGGRVVARHWS